jgi:transposase-like protein
MQLKIPKQEYTAEFKERAVRRVGAGQSAGVVARELGPVEQTLRNRVKAAAAGKLIRAIHAEFKGACGSPRITRALACQTAAAIRPIDGNMGKLPTREPG